MLYAWSSIYMLVMCWRMIHVGQQRYGTYRYSSTRSDQLIVSIVGTREVINCQLDRPKLSLRSRPIFIIPSTLHTDHQTCDRHALSLWRISCAFLNYLSFVYTRVYIYCCRSLFLPGNVFYYDYRTSPHRAKHGLSYCTNNNNAVFI